MVFNKTLVLVPLASRPQRNPDDTEMVIIKTTAAFVVLCCVLSTVSTHGPPQDRDSEDIAMGRKMGAKWCSMAKVCNHDRVPVCGVSHAGDIMGFRDLCDMFDFNCIRRRNYKQTSCPDDKSILTISRRPTSTFYDD
ncbi:uncharacterized protein LOC113238805 isoform X2 [Hyposmocoma kahamanoa]|uniref:uncharacterized protein LOC113238805 isoform X2 n=1 Tax=Hyposmocoma kahamanoa TaxID=1477025 RepID=UPI000E6D87C3|nr:uncharacterized protein LOC113238805 isoform X2 [Hyposmocoma kahamanoa]